MVGPTTLIDNALRAAFAGGIAEGLARFAARCTELVPGDDPLRGLYRSFPHFVLDRVAATPAGFRAFRAWISTDDFIRMGQCVQDRSDRVIMTCLASFVARLFLETIFVCDMCLPARSVSNPVDRAGFHAQTFVRCWIRSRLLTR